MISDFDAKQMQTLIEICHTNLKNSKQCLDYLAQNRGLKDQDIKKYKIGFFPQNIPTLLKWVDREFLFRHKILYPGNYSPFASDNYLIIPIYSEFGIPIGITGRSLMDGELLKLHKVNKYLHSGYAKSEILFGLNYSKDKILSKNQVVIVEGHFDFISLDSHGINNAVALAGKSCSSTQFIKLLRYADQVVFILDNDQAGRLGCRKVMEDFSHLRAANIKMFKTPNPYKDVDEYLSSGKNARSLFNDLEEISFDMFNPQEWPKDNWILTNGK